MEINQEDLLKIALDRLDQEGLWFTTKDDKLYANAKDLYKLDEYGELTNKAKERLVNEVMQYLGDGASFLIEAVDQWIEDNLIEGILGYVDTLAMNFEIPEVTEEVTAYSENGIKDLGAEESEEADQLKDHTEKKTESKKLTEGVSWEYYNKFDGVNDKYFVPSGEGETLASQIVVAINQLIYKWYNDGDVYDNSSPCGLTGGANDMSSYANWLAKYVDGAKEILDTIFNLDYGDEGEYEKILRRLADEYLDLDFLKTAEVPKEGSIYNCDGPYKFEEMPEDEDLYESKKIIESKNNFEVNSFKELVEYAISTGWFDYDNADYYAEIMLEYLPKSIARKYDISDANQDTLKDIVNQMSNKQLEEFVKDYLEGDIDEYPPLNNGFVDTIFAYEWVNGKPIADLKDESLYESKENKMFKKKIESSETVWVVSGNYGEGWERLCVEDSKKEAEERLKEYDENEPEYPHRIMPRSVKFLENKKIEESLKSIVPELWKHKGEMPKIVYDFFNYDKGNIVAQDDRFWIEKHSQYTEIPDEQYDAVIDFVKKIFPTYKSLYEGKGIKITEEKSRLDGDETYVAKNSFGYNTIGLIIDNEGKQFQLVDGQVMNIFDKHKKLSKTMIRQKVQELVSNGYKEYKGYGSLAEGVEEKKVTESTSKSNLKSDGTWIVGNIEIDGNVYKVNAKVFLEGSEFGIDDGPVSKLWVAEGNKCIINYDRGWDIEPTEELKPVYQEILKQVIEFRNKNPYKVSESIEKALAEAFKKPLTEGNVIPRDWNKITYKSKIDTNAGKAGTIFEVTKDDFDTIETNTETGETFLVNWGLIRNPNLAEIIDIEKKV